ncbi:MAG TPA: hypothetical protein DD723_02545 [Candidatus Omnitrophica bacterium]|nr:MAG: hypothetical protein A2Z81_01735 [Omnitrophica WOR_2 bacterium GWA2_45_18]HBR14407.1 hypothetical protein [Candidatus Omnitrophota bacterium]
MPLKHRPSDSKSVSVKSYPELVKLVQEELDALEILFKRRMTECYWKVGRYIDEHLLEHKDRAGYGKKVIERLAKDIEGNESILRKCLRFYRAYPILARGPELTWSHYRALMAIKNQEERKRLEKEVVEKKWDAGKLQEHLRRQRAQEAVKSDPSGAVPQLKCSRGRLNLWRLITVPQREGLFLDLGFRGRRIIARAKDLGLKEGDCVVIGRNDQEPVFEKTEASLDEIFTYKAQVLKVIDGDTLIVLIEAGFGFLIEQRVRLKGIDCAEVDTAEGQKAKRFVESRLNKLPFVIIKTHKDSTDKYDRYLADVFYAPAQTPETSPPDAARQGEYLNQELLTARLAVVYK